VVVGGIIPKKDETFIRERGVREVFHPYTPLETVLARVRAIATEARQKRGTSYIAPVKKKVRIL